MNYFEDSSSFSENFVVQLLNQCGISCHRNNLQDITAVDIITDQGVKVDAQYSNNFIKYGDFRLDIVSAFKPREVNKDLRYQHQDDLNIIQNFEQKFNCKVLKIGKLLQQGYLDCLTIMFYEKQFKRDNPDYLLLISKSELVSYIKPRVKTLFNQIILNNKPNLNDDHGSAFIPIKVSDLTTHTYCLFGSVQDFLQHPNDVEQYINQIIVA